MRKGKVPNRTNSPLLCRRATESQLPTQMAELTLLVKKGKKDG